MPGSITDDDARGLRRAWFDYLDAVEAVRAPLHAYGLRLSGNVWDAEDLVQEALLRGFAMIGRGDLHGAGSPVANARAYLFRTATHLFIDAERRRARERAVLAEPTLEPATAGGPDDVRDAGERLFAHASPQARAAVLLKDVYGFSLEESADLLRTTTGAVKAALSRGRAGLREPVPDPRPSPPRGLINAFVDAYNSHDLDRLLAAVTEAVSIEVPGVGGGRGLKPENGWADWSSNQPVRAQAARLDGEGRGGDPVRDARRRTALRGAPPGGRRRPREPHCRLLLRRRHPGLRRRGARLSAHAARLPSGRRHLKTMIATTTRPWDSPGVAAPAPPPPA
jgi:DNA-directed RNA polymerase specialized sigma24 family protein